ncbi:MAG: hypothetical protein CM1200mP18_12240 [Gammaproteobacteria bacterium]|nr:MAG: hypothetical protein CM1200mP18_12240 [Gammaproteobacteria bacterium]
MLQPKRTKFRKQKKGRIGVLLSVAIGSVLVIMGSSLLTVVV